MEKLYKSVHVVTYYLHSLSHYNIFIPCARQLKLLETVRKMETVTEAVREPFRR